MSLFHSLVNVLDTRVIIPVTSAVCYYIFKTYEPSTPLATFLILGITPASLAILLRRSFDSLAGAIATVSLTYWLLLVAFTITYRVSPLHPLTRYPGPLVCKISKGWIAYVAGVRGTTHLYIQGLHKQYGEIVRIGPNELSIIHKDVSNSVLGAKGLPRGPYYETRRHEAGVSLDGLRDPALHTVRRRPWARGMNSTSMKYYEELIHYTVGDLIDAFKQRGDSGEIVDLSKWMTFFGFDFMGHMAFTHDYDMLKTGCDAEGLYQLIDKALDDARWISHVPWAIPYLQHVPGATKNWKELQKIGDVTAERRLKLGSIQKDLFHHLMDEDGNEEVKPPPALVAVDGQLAIVAGADTAATTLSHLWYFLLRNPSCLDRLRKEVDDAFPPGEDSSLDLTKQGLMPYLNACINETLRLYPPVLAALQRRVTAGTGGRMIGPHFVPEETQVSVSAYAIQRDERCFSPLPNTFWPDRWLSQEDFVLPSGEVVPSEEVVTDRDCFIPFSQGPMVCAGKNAAQAEMRAVVCALLQQFDFKVVDQTYFETWEDKIFEMFTTKRGTLPVRVTTCASL